MLSLIGLFAACGLPAQELPAQDPFYLVDTFLGGDAAQRPALANNSALEDAQGIAVDASGNVYFSETSKHRIGRISPAGTIQYIAGVGRAGFSGDGGPATQAELHSPYGLALDAAGNLYIADLQNARIRMVSPDGRIRTVVGGGSFAPSPNGVAALETRLRAPRNLAIDNAGTLFISDFEDHRILRLTPAGRVFVYAGAGARGSATDGAALAVTFSAPAGLAVDRFGALYVADSGNHAIRRVLNGAVTTLRWAESDKLNLPTAISVDPAGNLYVASSGADLALRIQPSGATEILAHGARDVAMDRWGNLFVLSPRAVRKITPAGGITTLAGTAETISSLSDLSGALIQPADIKPDRNGGWILAELGGHRVRRVSPAGVITTLAGTGTPGYSGDGGAAREARLSSPQAVALDAEGNLYIADTENHRIRMVNRAGIITTVAGTGVAGFNGHVRQALEAQLNRPSGLAFDSLGWLIFSDTGNHRICRLIPPGLVVTIAGGNSAGFSGDGGPAYQAQFHSPRALAVDAQDNLYVGDTGNHRIRRIRLSGTVTTFAGTGRKGYSGEGVPATEANFSNVLGIAVDTAGNVFVSDSDNSRIRRISPSGAVFTIAGSGFRGFAGDLGPAREARFDDPMGLALDEAGLIFVADRLNHRIRRLTPVLAPVTTPLPADLPAELRISNAASMEASPVVPGMILTLQGNDLGPREPASGRITASGFLETALAGVQVRFDGQPAPVLYAQSNLVQVQAPYRLAAQLTTVVEVWRNEQLRARAASPVVAAAPAIFTTSAGSGPAAALNEDGSLNAASSPAAAGSLLTFYATGEGALDPLPVEGALTVDSSAKPVLPFQITVGGLAAEVVSFTPSATSPGISRVVIRIPGPLAPGPQPLVFTVGGITSQRGVTLFVR